MRDGDPLRIDLPPAVAAVLDALRQEGDEAVLVGGCVRDLVHGERPADWDVATSAPPEQVVSRFPGATWENAFGTVTVRDAAGGRGIEVTTYRLESGYRDQRRPDEVSWGTSLADDLARRDFTINAMAWRPDEGGDGSGRLVDPYGGAADLESRVLRAVGDPGARLNEDALRLLRGIRGRGSTRTRSASCGGSASRPASTCGSIPRPRPRCAPTRRMPPASPVSGSTTRRCGSWPERRRRRAPSS